MKLLIWRRLLKKGWYEVTWTVSGKPEKRRVFWDGEYFKRHYKAGGYMYHKKIKLFVKRMKK